MIPIFRISGHEGETDAVYRSIDGDTVSFHKCEDDRNSRSDVWVHWDDRGQYIRSNWFLSDLLPRSDMKIVTKSEAIDHLLEIEA